MQEDVQYEKDLRSGCERGAFTIAVHEKLLSIRTLDLAMPSAAAKRNLPSGDKRLSRQHQE
jgi:hypothetical protein